MRGTILRAPIQVLERDVALLKLGPQQSEEARELGENECLVTFVDRLDQARNEQVQLRGTGVGSIGIDECRVAGRLPEAQQRFEHLQLGVLPRIAPAAKQRPAVVIAQFVVEKTLPPFELAENRL